jgi:hypothetical protein
MVEAFGEGDRGAASLLEAKVQGSLRIIDAEVPGATPSHLLDAAAILWTARRIFAKAGIRIPRDPEWDEQGPAHGDRSLDPSVVLIDSIPLRYE